MTSARVDSVYIGGGTPSVLSERNIHGLFDIVHSLFDTSPGAEVTVEVNPNDVCPNLVAALRENGVNRISMGIQSFNNSTLEFLHRRHNSQEALKAVDTVVSGGIENLSIDLIYGIPGQTMKDWSHDLQVAFSLPISHLSAYSIIFEEGTRLTRMRNEGVVQETDEETCLQMFKLLMRKAREEGFLHYEISNFSLRGKQARHNTGYWNGMHYLGLGPGAHSYDGVMRRQNVCDLKSYVKAFSGKADNLACITQEEKLTETQRQEEMLLTSLRTAQGLCLKDYALLFGQDSLNGVAQRAVPFINNGSMVLTQKRKASFADSNGAAHQNPDTPHSFLALSSKGIFVSDYIISSLFE